MYYQLIFLGNTGCEACKKIRKHFFEMLEERGLDASLVAVLDGTKLMVGEYKSSKPDTHSGKVPVKINI